MRDYDWQIIVSLNHTKSITKTAALLFLSQSALTKRIKAIEDELGITLLIRTRQGSVLTANGEKIAKMAERIVANIQEVKDEALAHSSGLKSSLRLGCPYSFVRHILPSLLDRFIKENPNVDIDIITLPSQELVKCVEDGTIDVCLARYNAEDSPLERRLFSEDQACVVCDRPFSLEDISSMPCIDFYKNPGTESVLQRWWNERFTEAPRVRFNVTTSDACIAMIKHGLGYGFVLDSDYIGQETGLYSVPLEFTDGTKLMRKSWIYYRKESLRNPTIMNFIRMAELLK